MKVAVLMFYDNAVKAFGDINKIINQKYCDKFGLTLIVSNTRMFKSHHPAWERLCLILNTIESYDYVIWIDADAFFYNDVPNICDIIEKNSTVNFIFSKDLGNVDINSGFFIVKNTQYSIDFIKMWAYDKQLFQQNPKPHFFDQGVLVDMYNKNILNIKTNSIVIDYCVLQHFFETELSSLDIKPFVFHAAGRPYKYRYDVSHAYLLKHFNV